MTKPILLATAVLAFTNLLDGTPAQAKQEMDPCGRSYPALTLRTCAANEMDLTEVALPSDGAAGASDHRSLEWKRIQNNRGRD